MRASASPNAAWRPEAAVSGPVGLAETNSTCTRSPRSPAPKRVARVEHAAHGREVPGVGEEQVQEARAGDLDLLDAVAERLLERGAELLRDRARRLAQEGREQHRRVRRVVAEAGLLRALQGEAVGRAVGAQFAGGGLHRGAEVVERRAGHGAR